MLELVDLVSENVEFMLTKILFVLAYIIFKTAQVARVLGLGSLLSSKVLVPSSKAWGFLLVGTCFSASEAPSSGSGRLSSLLKPP